MMLFVYFQQGGIAMYPLLLGSILSIAILIERIVVLSRASRADRELAPVLQEMLTKGQVAEAVARCQRGEGPLARVLAVGLAGESGSREQRQKAVERALTRETGNLERYLPILATIGSIAPFVGLFGTVLGIMRAFRDIGLAGAAGGAVVAAGVAEALIATAMGLFVAVVAVIAFNHLMSWAQGILTNTQLNVEELLAQVEH
jgi:biopolymer transport protein ExbB/TolQ